jgi:hypothetical protein
VWQWLDLSILPVKEETLVLPYAVDKVSQCLWKATKPVKVGEEMPDISEEDFLFNGRIQKEHFQISRRVPVPENFLPLIKGRIESTPLGCIVFLRYRMFFSTNFFLAFWSTVTFLLGLFFVLYEQRYLYASAAFGLGLLNYTIVIHSFNLQVRKSRQLLDELFERLEASD